MFDYEDRLIAQLLYIFSDEVLQDFQSYIHDEFRLPSALWTIRKDGSLHSLNPKKQFDHYPQFCKNLQLNANKEGDTYPCNKNDDRRLMNILENHKADIGTKGWTISKCEMNISRLVFPLEINGHSVGIFVVGKFADAKDLILIEDKVNEITDYEKRKEYFGDIDHTKLSLIKRDLLESVKALQVKDADEVELTANIILRILPLLKIQYSRFQESQFVHHSISSTINLIDNLDSIASDIFLSFEDLWKKVNNILADLRSKLHFSSAITFLTDEDDNFLLKPESWVPFKRRPPEIAFPTAHSIALLEKQEMGLFLPSSDSNFSWLNDFCYKIFETKYAYIFAKTIFAQKIVLIGFGFRDGNLLNKTDDLLLKLVAVKLLKFIGNVVTTIELEQIMVETGHKLRRTHGDIQWGFQILTDYGIYKSFQKSDEIDRLLDDAYKSLEGGINQLDLIARNYHAFSKISAWIAKKAKGHSSELYSNIDVIQVLKQFETTYKVELLSDDKKVHYIFHIESCLIYSIEEAIILLLWNIFDNAVNFSYNGSFIEVTLSETEDLYMISISSRGIGVAPDEVVKVFSRHYKSRYKDPSRETSGRGLGLAICRQIFSFLFPSGSIHLQSFPALQKKSEERRFEGDNYITNVILKISKEDVLIHD